MADVTTVFDAYVRTAMRMNLACMEAAGRVIQMSERGVPLGDLQAAKDFMDDSVRVMAEHLLTLRVILTEAAGPQ